MKQLALFVGLLIATFSAFAQEADLRASRGPYYEGVAITLQLVTEGFERSPQPKVEVKTPDNATLQLVGVSPNVSTSIQIINGRTSRSERVQFVYSYQLTPSKTGSLAIGPFEVSQGSKRATARGARFQIEALEGSNEQRFLLQLPSEAVWVGQRVPVSIEWWLTEAFAERLAGRVATVPLFDQVEHFQFEEVPNPENRQPMTINGKHGSVAIDTTVRREQWEGKDYIVVSGQRIVIPLTAGEHQIPPAKMVTEEAVRWSKDFFGNRVPSQTRRTQTLDIPRTLQVKSPPLEGRPPSFSGAVGKGFSLSVSADRSVVNAGDPIRLKITVRGDSSLEGLALPPLQHSGLAVTDFKVPDSTPGGRVETDAKHFEVVVRVKHADVQEIPPISFSWFNPESGSYESTTSRPIALSVSAANKVSATDVISNAVPVTAATDARQSPASSSKAQAVQDVAGALSRADLAIETNLTKQVQGHEMTDRDRLVLAALYGLSGLLVLGAYLRRRRSQISPAQRAQQAALTQADRDIATAKDADALARALRLLVAANNAGTSPQVDALLDELDQITFSRAPAAAKALDPRYLDRARSLAAAIGEKNRG